MNPPQLLTLQEAATRTPDKRYWKTLERWTRDGLVGVKLRVTWVGGRRYIKQDDLDEFLKEINRRKDVVPEKTPRRRTRRGESECRRRIRQRHGI